MEKWNKYYRMEKRFLNIALDKIPTGRRNIRRLNRRKDDLGGTRARESSSWLSILLSIMFHALMGRFHLELMNRKCRINDERSTGKKHTTIGWDDAWKNR